MISVNWFGTEDEPMSRTPTQLIAYIDLHPHCTCAWCIGAHLAVFGMALQDKAVAARLCRESRLNFDWKASS